MRGGHLGVEPLADQRPATQRSHVGLGSGLFHKGEASGGRPDLELLPLLPPPAIFGLSCSAGRTLFLKLSPSAWAKRQTCT